jgi:hypothetical protein
VVFMLAGLSCAVGGAGLLALRRTLREMLMGYREHIVRLDWSEHDYLDEQVAAGDPAAVRAKLNGLDRQRIRGESARYGSELDHVAQHKIALNTRIDVESHDQVGGVTAGIVEYDRVARQNAAKRAMPENLYPGVPTLDLLDTDGDWPDRHPLLYRLVKMLLPRSIQRSWQVKMMHDRQHGRL